MDSSDHTSFRRKLREWYVVRARDLPWRRTADPYQIWISEIMLQQTTVAAVIPFFQRFMARFPDLKELARAEETEILRYWEGLGYYSRARNILRAAKVIVEQHEGQFPTDLVQLQSLPGIGRYTAGAIASFAFDQRAPIVEANTLRLYCRLLGYEGDPRSKGGQEQLWTFAENILPRKQPGQVNQALMELGATVCTPRDPACGECPVQSYCQAYLTNRQSTIPRPKPKVAITAVTEVSIAVRNGAKFLVRRRTADERWAGLWDFIRFEVPHESPTLPDAMIVQSTQERTGLTIELGPQVAQFNHSVTRYRITLICFVANRIDGRLKKDEEWQWITAEELEKFPLSVTARQFAQRLHPSGRAIVEGQFLLDGTL
ncbi:A/G-specific adenine glycosylase [Schlesneria sp. DSM 10557]|uniref:A/G-specific adenine glycosylase n=1 Tax=Schlesneria sp. DSM 10557 TaxID=3044399 RepID=UPI0035A1325A